MKLLLDTHLAVWGVARRQALSPAARAMVEDEANELFVSAVTIWEIAIKHALPRGRAHDMPMSGTEALARFEEARFAILPMTAAHAAAVDDLPRLHGDLFDRLLIVQAMQEPLRLLTVDKTLAAYGAMVMLV